HPGGQAGIFLDHINWLHSVVTGKLGKRMMVWDDMFQHYPEVLSSLPRDIVLGCWDYGLIEGKPRWHFGDRPAIDKLEEFSSFGFECLIAPADSPWLNPVTFTRYAETRPCLGGLLTMWEKGTSFYHASLPVVAATGKLCSGLEPEAAIQQAVKTVFGFSDPVFSEAIRSFSILGQASSVLPSNLESYLHGGLTDQQHQRRSTARLISQVLKKWETRLPTEIGRQITGDILQVIDQLLLHYQLAEILPIFCSPETLAGEKEK
ncbi:MAG: hypothetical protein NC911_06095, partial [Candidatus Omnitrophica bacterium]|nr:hypothetical protein [Candidatus Omnitrophota bacterium]